MSRPRKIGVLTFHRCINYGSYWQARCLVEGLRQRGHDAVLLDHDSPLVNRAEWRCALRPLLPTPTPKTDYPLYASKTRQFLKAFTSLPRSDRRSEEHTSELQSLMRISYAVFCLKKKKKIKNNNNNKNKTKRNIYYKLYNH